MMNNFESMQKQGQENMDLAMKSLNAVSKGFQEIAKEAADYAKSSFDNSSAVAEKLMAVKSPEKAFEIQSEFAKSAYETFVAQATRMGELYVGVAKEAYKPFEGIMPKAAK
ncbi:MAG: phasin family protein [Rhizobiaceae bacterium]